MARIPAVRVKFKNPEHGGEMIVNKDDYNPELHELMGDALPPPELSPEVQREADIKTLLESLADLAGYDPEGKKVAVEARLINWRNDPVGEERKMSEELTALQEKKDAARLAKEQEEAQKAIADEASRRELAAKQAGAGRGGNAAAGELDEGGNAPDPKAVLAAEEKKRPAIKKGRGSDDDE